MDGTLKWSRGRAVNMLFKERGISGVWRSGFRKALSLREEDTGHVSKQGPRRGRGWGGFSPPPPHFFENYKELLRKKCFQPPHFESLVSPPTFKIALRALANCMLKHCLPLKTFIPVFVAFFVLLGIALSCIRKM